MIICPSGREGSEKKGARLRRGLWWAVFPKGPAAARQRGIWHPSGLTALGAKGCIEGLHRFAQGKGLGGRVAAWRLGSKIGIEDRGDRLAAAGGGRL